MSVLILSKRAHMHAHTQEEGERSTACKRTRCSRVAQTKTIQAPILDALLTTIVPENITAASRRGRGWYSPAVAEKLAALSTVRATWWISCSRVNKHSGRESYTDGRTHTHTHTHTHTLTADGVGQSYEQRRSLTLVVTVVTTSDIFVVMFCLSGLESAQHTPPTGPLR